jgi:hypothetical protein
MDPILFRIAHQPNVGLLIASAIEADRFRSGAPMAPAKLSGGPLMTAVRRFVQAVSLAPPAGGCPSTARGGRDGR